MPLPARRKQDYIELIGAAALLFMAYPLARLLGDAYHVPRIAGFCITAGLSGVLMTLLGVRIARRRRTYRDD